jgi:hypothetical protein
MPKIQFSNGQIIEFKDMPSMEDIDSAAKSLNLQPEPQPEPAKNFTGLEKAPFQATGNENLLTGTAKAVGNLPKSTFELGKSVASAVLNPIYTIKSVGTLVKRVGAKVGESILEDTDLGQRLLSKANENRLSQGQPELKKDINGKFQVEDTPDLQAINQVGKFFMDRYGTLDKFKETAIEDPASVFADLATVLTGGGAILSKTGQVSKVSQLSKAGEVLTATGKTLEPVNLITKTATKGKNVIKQSTVGRVTSEAIPTINNIKQNQIVKALDLTQGDLATISKKTGNDVSNFIIDNNLIKNTPEEVADALNVLRASNKAEKSSIIQSVTNIYTPEQVPSVRKGLGSILEDVDGVAGLEKIADEIRTLIKKDSYTLDDVQNAQYLLDDNSSIYSKIGDAKSTTKAKGLDNIRKDSRSFIENEVDIATGGQTNIKKINNDIQTSFAIEDAINTRATRNLTRQKISLGDWAALGVGTTINPLLGIGLYIGKKLVETPSFRLAFTKALNAQPINRVKTILSEVAKKKVSPATQKLINQITNEARNNLQLIESGSNALEQTKSERKPQKDQ